MTMKTRWKTSFLMFSSKYILQVTILIITIERKDEKSNQAKVTNP